VIIGFCSTKRHFQKSSPVARKRRLGAEVSAFSRGNLYASTNSLKMQEALQASHDVASEFNQQEITNEHSLLALLDQSEGIARPLLEKIGASPGSLWELLQAALQKLPAVTGDGVELRTRSLIVPLRCSRVPNSPGFGSLEVAKWDNSPAKATPRVML
jgi:hypothetical protein